MAVATLTATGVSLLEVDDEVLLAEQALRRGAGLGGGHQFDPLCGQGPAGFGCSVVGVAQHPRLPPPGRRPGAGAAPRSHASWPRMPRRL